MTATRRVEITFTEAEWQKVRALADANQWTVADMLRLGILTIHADLTDGEDPLVILDGQLQPIIGRV